MWTMRQAVGMIMSVVASWLREELRSKSNNGTGYETAGPRHSKVTCASTPF